MEEKKPSLKVELHLEDIKLLSTAVHHELLDVENQIDDAENTKNYYRIVVDNLEDRKYSREMQGKPYGEINNQLRDARAHILEYTTLAGQLKDQRDNLQVLAAYFDDFLDEEQRHG